MISNTDLFYAKTKQFQDERKKIEDSYEKDAESLERFKGSAGYDEEMRKITQKYKEDIKALQDEYRPGLYTVLGGMMDEVGKRPIKAPTTDAVNLLNVLKMKKKVTLEDCQRTAASVKDNPIALSIITEIAHDHGILRSFEDMCSEMSSQTASDIVKSLRSSLDDFLEYSTTRASRIAKNHHEQFYGASSPLTKRPIFNDKNGCFYEIGGLKGDALKAFSDIVDGEKND